MSRTLVALEHTHVATDRLLARLYESTALLERRMVGLSPREEDLRKEDQERARIRREVRAAMRDRDKGEKSQKKRTLFVFNRPEKRERSAEKPRGDKRRRSRERLPAGVGELLHQLATAGPPSRRGRRESGGPGVWGSRRSSTQYGLV